MTSSAIISHFEKAAKSYDLAATAQKRIAKRLVSWASESNVAPLSACDLGCGTGFVAEEIYQRWPHCKVTAMDASVAMLNEAQRKMPQLSVLHGNLLTYSSTKKYDVIFCNMALHWLPEPLQKLKGWKSWLNTNGKLFAALPVDDSFPEWHKLCQKHKIDQGLWLLPSAQFANSLTSRTSREDMLIAYSSVHDFLRSMKVTGSATPRPDHKPINAALMRKILKEENHTFPVTFRLLLLEISGSDP